LFVNDVFYSSKQRLLLKACILHYSMLVKIVPNTINRIQICYIIKGSLTYINNGFVCNLVKGDIIVSPPNTGLDNVAGNENDAVIFLCEFSMDLLNKSIYGSNSNTTHNFDNIQPFIKPDFKCYHIHLTSESRSRVESLLQEMVHECERQDKYYEECKKAQLILLLSIIARECEKVLYSCNTGPFEKNKETIYKIIDYVGKNYNQKIDIKKVCKTAAMSCSSFSYLFKKITGKTFVKYLIDFRLQKAMELLSDTSESITEISYSVGFTDTTYFDRVFKKQMNLSPRQYRKSLQEVKL